MLDADAKNYEYALSPEVKRAERERVLDIKRRIGTSSLNFGNYPMDYVSDMTRSNQNILEHASRTRRGSASTERRKNKAGMWPLIFEGRDVVRAAAARTALLV